MMFSTQAGCRKALLLEVCVVFMMLLRLEAQYVSSISICNRWAHASGLIGEILYIYGGYANYNLSDTNRTTYLVSRDFIQLDLSQNFDIDDPPFGALAYPPIPGPPKVSYGIFWPDQNHGTLTFYGGLYEDNPKDPNITDLQLWSYNTQQSSWYLANTPGRTISRAAEGASAFMDGIGYYRGGHIDSYNVPGWDNSIPRVYLAGMLEYSTQNNTLLNITTGFDIFDTVSTGYQDGVLVPVILDGRKYLINFGGGAAKGTELSLANCYIYDIEVKQWYIQPIQGTPPLPLRDACAVVSYASDNSSANIYVYGGKANTGNSFTPQGEMWVLSLPAFIWIQVSVGLAGDPLERTGHTCHLVGRNMVVVGGKTSATFTACDGKIVYIYDTFLTAWKSKLDTSLQDHLVPFSIFNIIGGDAHGNASWKSLPAGGTVPAISPPDKTSPMLKLSQTDDTTTTTATNTPTSIQSQVNPSPHNHVPIGAIIGAVIGGMAVVLAVIFGVCFIQRRHRRKTTDVPNIPQPAGIQHQRSTPDMSYFTPATGKQPLNTFSPQELPTNTNRDSIVPAYSSIYDRSPPLSPDLYSIASYPSPVTAHAFPRSVDTSNKVSEMSG